MWLIINIFLNILCIISFVIAHEMGHALVLKYYNIPFKFGTTIIRTWTTFNEEDFYKIKNDKLFWAGGSLSSGLLGLVLCLFSLFGLDIKYGIYGITMALINAILIIPDLDFYKFLNLDNIIKWTDENLHWRGLWIYIGIRLSFILSVFVMWKLLF